MKTALPLLVLPLTLAFAACESMPQKDDARPAAAAEADGDAKNGESAAEAVAKKERALENARLEFKIAEASAKAATRKAQDEVDEAEFALRKASEALEHFTGPERDLELSKAQLGVERASWGLEAQKQELAELEAMYKKDDVATLTKELVLQRGKKQVEFAVRNLEHEQREAAMQREYELPRKQRELEMQKRKAENALREAKADKDKTTDEVELKLRKAKAELEDAEKALEKARAKAGSAQP